MAALAAVITTLAGCADPDGESQSSEQRATSTLLQPAIQNGSVPSGNVAPETPRTADASAPNSAPLPPPDSDQPPKIAFIFPENFSFFYTSIFDKRFHGQGIFAVELPKAAEIDYANVYLSAKRGEFPAAKAKTPFLLTGWLPGGHHPSDFSHRVVEASIEGQDINCELHFTYHVIPGAGPGIPRHIYFAARMPALPEGDYVIRFRIIRSYFDRGDGLMRLDPKRDSLTNTPYAVTFSIQE